MSALGSRRYGLTRAFAMIGERPGAFLLVVLLAATALTLPMLIATLGYSALPLATRLKASSGPEVSVFAAISASPKDIESLKASIAKINGVRSVRHLPRDQAWADLAKRTGLSAASTERANPLPDVLVARFDVDAEPTAIERAAEAMRTLTAVDAVRADIEWHRRLSALARALLATFAVLGALAGILVVLVVLSAAREQAVVRREEIALLRLSGATLPFMIRPYGYLGALTLVLATTLAIAAVIGAVTLMLPSIVAAAEVIGQRLDLRWPPLWILGAVTGGMALLGWAAGVLGGWRAVAAQR
ncbi:MAG: cell division protein FtsX [Burkholderiaceae bacterium]